jgi:hypothetical protein
MAIFVTALNRYSRSHPATPEEQQQLDRDSRDFQM